MESAKNVSGDKRARNPTPMEDNGSTLASDQKKAEHMNKFFASVSRSVDLTDQDREQIKELKSQEKAPKPNISLFEQPFSKNELRQALSKLNQEKHQAQIVSMERCCNAWGLLERMSS